MNDNNTDEIVRMVTKEYALHTNEKIEAYYERTSHAIKDMSESILKMSEAVQSSSRQLARYEERQNSVNERMERIESSVKKQGVDQRNFETTIQDNYTKLRMEVINNTFVRKMIVWVAGAIIATMIGGGVLFGTLTGKTVQQQPTIIYKERPQ